MNSMREFLFLQALQSFLWNCAIFLVAFLSFATFSLFDVNGGKLTATTAFVSLAIFNNMRALFRMIPSCISSWYETRLGQFRYFIRLAWHGQAFH